MRGADAVWVPLGSVSSYIQLDEKSGTGKLISTYTFSANRRIFLFFDAFYSGDPFSITITTASLLGTATAKIQFDLNAPPRHMCIIQVDSVKDDVLTITTEGHNSNSHSRAIYVIG